ncbi:MAG TPA: peptidoglycan bridge formation glycyltransferase FemA/FemB family protein, partial [Gemmatimonadales bacterium]|nr:peptidoglycan bridge formation glycyltransferase FemA/FemB family protein [Gemmatimonadales bacterium]
FDSFDAGWEAPALPGAMPGPRRHEYLVPLSGNADEPWPELARTHRRHLRTGDRSGWLLRRLAGPVGVEALQRALDHAAERRLQRGQFMGTSLSGLREPSGAVSAPWGSDIFACYEGELLLGAVLVGWTRRRAYYIRGGSTPEGYQRSASVWLHCAVMRTLAQRGLALYNLGGTPATAERPEDEQHGLHRFKCGFGAEVVRCRGARWCLDRRHQRVHHAAAWVSGWLGAVGSAAR